MIFDLNIDLGHHQPYLYKVTNLINKCQVCSYCSTVLPLPVLLLLLGLSIPWETYCSYTNK
jgi:hypothetical protein